MARKRKLTRREMEIAIEAPHLMRNIQVASKCGATLFDIVELGARTGYKNLSPIFRKGLLRINKQGESVDLVLEDIAKEIDFDPVSSPIHDLIRGNLEVDEIRQDYLARKSRRFYERETDRMSSGLSAVASGYKMPISVLTSVGMVYIFSQMLGGVLSPIYPILAALNFGSTGTTIWSMKKFLKDSLVLPQIVENLEDKLEDQQYYPSKSGEVFEEKPSRVKSWAKKVLPVELSESTRVIQQMDGLIEFLGLFGENMLNGYSREYSLSEAAKKYKRRVSDNSADYLVRSLIFEEKVLLDDVVSRFELETDSDLVKVIKSMERRDIVKFIRGRRDSSKKGIIGAKLKEKKRAEKYLQEEIRGGERLKLAKALMEGSRMIYEGGGSFDEAWSYVSRILHPSFREDFRWLNKISSKNSIRAGELSLLLANVEYKKEQELIEDRREKLEDSVGTLKDVQIAGMKVAGVFYGIGQGFFTSLSSMSYGGSLFTPPSLFELVLYGTAYFSLDFPLTAMYLATDTYDREDTFDRMKHFISYYLVSNVGTAGILALARLLPQLF